LTLRSGSSSIRAEARDRSSGRFYAAEHWVYVAEVDEENPAREFRLGFDCVGRLLELVVLRFDSGHELVIHAMKARRQYLDLIS